MNIVGIYGFAGSGKTSLANILKQLFPCKFAVNHLADQLKREAAEYYGIPIETFYSHTKKDKRLSIPVAPTDRTTNAIITAVGASEYFTPRDLLIAYGAFRRFYYEDYWIDKLLKEYSKCFEPNDKTILLIPDVRFQNEVLEIKSRGGLLIQVVRDGLGCKREDDSEVQQKDFVPDIVIKSKSGLDNLEKAVKEHASKIFEYFKVQG